MYLLSITQHKCFRWGLIPSTSIHTEDVLTLTDLMTVPLLMYLLWQAGFLLATELLLADKLRADPTLVTSVRCWHRN